LINRAVALFLSVPKGSDPVAGFFYEPGSKEQISLSGEGGWLLEIIDRANMHGGALSRPRTRSRMF
jgi:subtilisin-like proprotein convertase family protein